MTSAAPGSDGPAWQRIPSVRALQLGVARVWFFSVYGDQVIVYSARQHPFWCFFQWLGELPFVLVSSCIHACTLLVMFAMQAAEVDRPLMFYLFGSVRLRFPFQSHRLWRSVGTSVFTPTNFTAGDHFD